MTTNPTDGAGGGTAPVPDSQAPQAAAETPKPAALTAVAVVPTAAEPPPSAPPAPGGSADAPPAAPAPAPPAQRRALKVVVNLQPLPAGDTKADAGVEAAEAYRAVVGVGADGCDPVLRALRVDGLAGALDEVPALAAEVEAKWQSEPRNPRLAPAPAAKTARASKAAPPAGAKGATSPAAPSPAPEPATKPAPAAPPAAAEVPSATPAAAPPAQATDAQPKGGKGAPAGQLSLFG